MARIRSRPWLRISATRSDGLITGRSEPHATIEAINLSRIATRRLCLTDTIAIATTTTEGVFTGRIAGVGGDMLRLRARDSRRALSPWLTIRLPACKKSRAPDVALFRIGFRKLRDEHYGLVNIGRPRPISEPGAVLLVENLRTSALYRVVLGLTGSFANHHRIVARPGDQLVVRMSHSPRHRLGTLTVPSANEQMMDGKRLSRLISGHRDTLYDVRGLRGPLTIGRPKACEVIQGEVPNCHLAGAVSAIAHVRGDHIAGLIRRIDSEHFRVSLFRYDKTSGRFARDSVVVSNKIYVRACGSPLFGAAITPAASTRHGAIWWPILEKAYAEFHGGYGHFENGGTAHHALSVVLGRPPRYREIGPRIADRLWSETVRQLGARLPVVVSTAGEHATRLYRNTLIMPDHCYAVQRCFTVETGQRMAALRNPWGEVTPPHAPASRDGSFSMPWETVMRLFSIWSTVEQAR